MEKVGWTSTREERSIYILMLRGNSRFMNVEVKA